ncbi:MAG: glycerophosphodiester phosphodiesterase family protein, partial [Planctomycetota bacterium]
IAGGCLVSVSAATEAPEVTRLEASHVAEIHTGGASTGIALETREDRPCYVVHSRRGDQVFRVEVDALHGRLLTIDEEGEGGWRQTYRWPGVRVVAHRGGALLGPPENTLPAIDKAIAIGADLIEIDIRQTADGHLVLMHDETVDRTTNGVGRVDQMTLAEIGKLTVNSQGAETVRVPTLEEALAAMKGRIDPDLDFKEGDLQPLLRVVRKLDLAPFCTLHGSWERSLKTSVEAPLVRVRPSAEFPLQVPLLIRTVRPAIVNLDWHAVTEEAVRLAHLGGCQAFVNCLGSADTELYAKEAIRIGADYIQSDRPDLVIDLLQQQGMRDERPPRGDALQTPLRSPHLQYPLR